MYKRFVKRGLDFLIALAVLVVFSPLYLILILLVRVRIGSPVFFHQDRPGKGERIFRLYKFRSMTDKRDKDGNLLPDKDRLTSLGRVLRRTSLDELPEFFNILKGDMSLVGPRPLLKEYLPYYTKREQLRHTVRPGLTGLAQANGRNLLDWDKRLELDAQYVERLSFALDCKILRMTVQTIFSHAEQVAEDTNAAEGNLAEIRRKKAERKEHT